MCTHNFCIYSLSALLSLFSYVDDVTVKLKQLMRNSLLRDVQVRKTVIIMLIMLIIIDIVTSITSRASRATVRWGRTYLL